MADIQVYTEPKLTGLRACNAEAEDWLVEHGCIEGEMWIGSTAWVQPRDASTLIRMAACDGLTVEKGQ